MRTCRADSMFKLQMLSNSLEAGKLLVSNTRRHKVLWALRT